ALVGGDDGDFSPDFLSSVREETPRDSTLVDIYRALTTKVDTPKKRTMVSRFQLNDGMLWYMGNRLVIPLKHRMESQHDHNDSNVAGHASKNYTYKLLA